MKTGKSSLSDFIRERTFLKKLMPGIRFKFSMLMGVFVSFILAAATYINYINQSSILKKNFDNETENSLNYINPIVNSIDSIRTNLLLIEDMKIRVNEKSEDLKKYRTYALKRKNSFFNSFKNIGKKLGLKVKYDYYLKGYESYYSTYLSKKDISLLEKITASQLKRSDGSDISESEFKELQKKAGRVAQLKKRIDLLQDRIDMNSEKLASLKEDRGKETDLLKNQNQVSERQLAVDRKRIGSAERIFRNRLNLYYNNQLKRLEETGIYNSNIRIITYNNAGDPGSDTSGYFKDSLVRFSPLFENINFEKDREDFFSSINIYSSIKIHEYDYTSHNRYYHVSYVPVYKNPAVSQRLTAVIRELDSNSGKWLQFLKEDSRICAGISQVTGDLRKRLDVLRENKKVPGKDGEFLSLYSVYKKLLAERDNAFVKYAPYHDEMKQITEYYKSKIKTASAELSEEIKKLGAIKQEKDKKTDDDAEDIESAEAGISELKDEIERLKHNMEEAREDIWQSDKLSARDAMRYMREAALYDYAVLKQKPDPLAYRNYLRSSVNRKTDAKRWETLRGWIMAALSETGIPASVRGAKGVKFAENGILAYSRSEIEEYMWHLDSTPLAGKTGLLGADIEGGLAEDLFTRNISGFHGVFIDKTEGIKKIALNRDRMAIYSLITALVAIVMTYFLAGFMVKRIKNLIEKVKITGTGDLKTVFPEKGLDEIEDLAVSLNVMVRGLRQKEELEGEIAAAGEIQKTLLPEKIPSNLDGHYSIGTFYRSMQGVGGDYYDFIELDEDSMFFCIADVSSHGVGPAIVMSMLRAHIHGILRRGIKDLAGLLLELNRQIFIETPPAIFVTIFTGIVNKKTNEIEYCSAGHLKPVLCRSGQGKIEILDAGGLPVGMDDNDIFSDTITVRKIQMKAGDVFFQYTDGVSEAMDNSRNLFGEERMYEEIKKHSRGKPEFMITKIAEAVESFTGKMIINSSISELNDDIAMIALKRTR